MYACQKWYFYRSEKGIYRLRQIFVHYVGDKPHVTRTPLLVFNNNTKKHTFEIGTKFEKCYQRIYMGSKWEHKNLLNTTCH